MDNQKEISFNNIDTLEIHYWFLDKSHSMDAVIQNKCEYEVLGLLKEISKQLDIEIIIETEPLGEGGLRKWLRIITKDENKKATISTAIIISLATVLLTTPISKVTEKLIDKIFEDKELKQLEKEKLKLEIEKLKTEIYPRTNTLQTNNIVKKKRSNFYEALEKYPKIEKVSFVTTDTEKNEILHKQEVVKSNFKNYILTSNDLEPKEVEEANIEIISPVLKKGGYKWLGIYEGETIIFGMQSNEFKTLVQVGQIEFKNGSSINCQLEINRKIDNEGIEKISGYKVVRVNHYFENDKPIETPEGKKYRQIKEADKMQTRLFDEPENRN